MNAKAESTWPAMNTPNRQSSSLRRSKRAVRAVRGSDSKATTQAYTATRSPVKASVSPRSAAISGNSPMGSISVVTKMKAARASVKTGTQRRLPSGVFMVVIVSPYICLMPICGQNNGVLHTPAPCRMQRTQPVIFLFLKASGAGLQKSHPERSSFSATGKHRKNWTARSVAGPALPCRSGRTQVPYGRRLPAASISRRTGQRCKSILKIPQIKPAHA